MNFGHVAIRVGELEAVLDFYCRGLGLTEAFRIYNDDGSLRIVYLHISHGAYIELCVGGTLDQKRNDAHTKGVRHICFVVEDIENERLRIEKEGFVFDSDILILRDQNKTMYLSDPEGNSIELMEITPNSPQKVFSQKYKTD